MITTLAEASADLQVRTSEGYTPPYLAAHDGHSAVMTARIEAGANLNARLPGGQTPLYAAAASGHVDAARVLLHAKANPLFGRTFKTVERLPRWMWRQERESRRWFAR